MKIRVLRNVLASWSSFPISLGDQVQKKIFVEDDATPCELFRWLVLNPRMLKSLRNGTTESSFIWFWDTMIRSVLDFVFSEADIGRDSSSGSSTAKKRPDFCLILNEVGVFRGEEKEPGVDIKLPRSKFEEELIWSYEKVPYLFGYAASGFKIRLFALTRGINDAASANTFQLRLFNLEDLADRFRLLLALLNLCFLFPAITEECPDSGRRRRSSVRSGETRRKLLKIWKNANTDMQAVQEALASRESNMVAFIFGFAPFSIVSLSFMYGTINSVSKRRQWRVRELWYVYLEMSMRKFKVCYLYDLRLSSCPSFGVSVGARCLSVNQPVF